MLRELHIRNYAVVENLSLEFFPGLSVLSGETGSGKSILIDALGLVLGGRASPDVIRTGQERATVTAVFQLSGEVNDWLEEFGLDGALEKEVILRREIQAGGKSRLLVNDQPVTLTAIRSLARRIIDIHGQNEHVSLLARDAQLELLDQFAETEGRVNEVAGIFRRRQELQREMEALTQSEQERLRALDLLQFQVEELQNARLDPGEDARLEEERRMLANVEKLRAAASAAFDCLHEDEGSALARLAVAEKSLEELARYDVSAGPYLEPLASARASIEDFAAFLRSYLGRLEADPLRLEEVEDRLAMIDRLKRKYGKSIDEILAYAAEAAAQLEKLEHADERRNEIALELEKVNEEYRRAAQALSAERRATAKTLAKKVRQELAQLGMEKAVFEIQFTSLLEAVGGIRGTDEIEILISPNPGEQPRPLERTASGGELSRLMLALKTVGGEKSFRVGNGKKQNAAPRTFIFDEVDAGIGGRVAECVGQRLKQLAQNAQVLCVTHLPQIACFADHHYYVEKAQHGGRTITEVRLLASQKDRAAELARMLSGSQITDAVLEHAAAMLRAAEEKSAVRR
ncbi:MAG TPA: DNA repair protein RecN [Terriglobia bacterium]|nr:DNA repair protein RecN [Terriglobia bacterium]